jgi:hypothetical protein
MLERSQDISIAILSRGFDYNIGARTYRREFTFHRADFIMLGVIFALILLGLTLKNLGLCRPPKISSFPLGIKHSNFHLLKTREP